MFSFFNNKKLLYSLIIIVILPIASLSQKEDSLKKDEIQKEIEKRRAIVNAYVSDTGVERTLQLDIPFQPDSLTSIIQQSTWKSYYEYKNFGYVHRKNVFKWQLISSKLIFFVVIGLVLSGIYFAGLQFFHAIKLSKKAGDLEKIMNTELAASSGEIKVSSPVLGVIILVLSFLFFFLYLKFVYPIQDTF